MENKGQAQQIFVYMIMIIVVGLILLIGYKVINSTIDSGCDIKMINFKSDISVYADKYTSWGVVKNERLTAPCNVEEVCFVNNDRDLSDLEDSIMKLYGNTSDLEKINVFLKNSKETLPFLELETLKPTDPNKSLCVPVRNGVLNLKFEGKGRYVMVSESEK